MIRLNISVEEFKRVESEINTWYHSRYKDNKIIVHLMPDYIYIAFNKGFNKYIFYDKIINDGTRKEWS